MKCEEVTSQVSYGLLSVISAESGPWLQMQSNQEAQHKKTSTFGFKAAAALLAWSAAVEGNQLGMPSGNRFSRK